jgi:hypothetical protein
VVFVRTGRVWVLTLDGRAIHTTGEHPFFAENQGWKPLAELAVGDRLLGESGDWLTIEALEDTGRYETVYNLRVSETHTYFIGEVTWGWCVWAHNYDFDSDENYQALKARYAQGLDAHGRTPEQARVHQEQVRRQQYTARMLDDLANETGYSPLASQRLIDLHDDQAAFYRQARKYGYKEQGEPGRGKSVESLHRRVGEMLAARERYATQAQDHHAIPWDNSQYPHQYHLLVQEAGVDLYSHGPNIGPVIGHAGPHWEPYHLAVDQRLTNAYIDLITAGSLNQTTARRALNEVIHGIWEDIGSGQLPMYAPPRTTQLVPGHQYQ